MDWIVDNNEWIGEFITEQENEINEKLKLLDQKKR